jgi:serralysin
MAKNVAFISIDDLINVVRFRDAYGTPFLTPNIDRLLQMGTYFNGAHAVVPVCNPSRASTLTGLSPFRTGVEDNSQDFFKLVDPTTTLPYLFKQVGYETAAVGKVFHGSVHLKNLDSERVIYLRQLFDILQPNIGHSNERETRNVLDGIGPTRFPESELVDYKAVEWAADYVTSRSGDDPWFLAVGLKKPHLQWKVPERYYDLYDRSMIAVPANLPDDFEDVPLFFQQFLEHRFHRMVLASDRWEDAIQAYMAAVSYADAQLGTFLRAMDQADAWSDTTLVLWSDHGYHLGDKATWGKFTHWENATNAPLIIVDPDVGRPGTVVSKPVSLMDVFPTLTELAGIPDRIGRDGHSLVPLLRDPDAEWHHFAGSIMQGSISLRTDRYRYIASLDGSEQLYDMARDPEQVVNLARVPGHRAQLKQLHNRAAEEIERLGGRLGLVHERLDGSRRDDTFFVSPNIETAFGGDGDDSYLALSPAAIVERPGGGFDTLTLFASAHGVRVRATVPHSVELTILADNAGGLVMGTEVDDVVRGGKFADRLLGREGRDGLDGGGSRDLLAGGPGADVVDGGRDDDFLRGDTGDDRLRGGGGRDVLRGGDGDDRLRGEGGSDLLDAARGGDRLHGGSGSDRMQGGLGADALVGAGGDDALGGGADRDRHIGGEGDDMLWGGKAADVFVYRGAASADLIRDFTPGVDRIDLTALGLHAFEQVSRDTTAEGCAVARVRGVEITFQDVTWSELGNEDFIL